MPEKELIAELVALAEKAASEHPRAAACLYSLSGAVTAGPPTLHDLFLACTDHSSRFIQFVTGDGESVS